MTHPSLLVTCQTTHQSLLVTCHSSFASSIVNYYSSIFILPSVFCQSSIKDCHSKGSHKSNTQTHTPYSLQLPFCRSCTQRALPPHYLNLLLWRWCMQRPLPPHSLQRLFCCPCTRWPFLGSFLLSTWATALTAQLSVNMEETPSSIRDETDNISDSWVLAVWVLMVVCLASWSWPGLGPLSLSMDSSARCTVSRVLPIFARARESTRERIVYLRRCKTSSVGQSAGLAIMRSPVRFRQKLKSPRTRIYMDLSYIDPQAKVLKYCFK